ncbi:hypothetical protein LIER_40666 [Lithospermum erythrorhizon]|uniref:Uncharacterized protein n=1 Tax=Lithospermum erythrorhizon TaxID=34254 RepID=A0AAV3R1C3_LITER
MAHRRFLDADHPWHYDTKAFDGEMEKMAAPEPLDIPGKSKDHHKARLDLQEMGIRPELHPQESGDDREHEEVVKQKLENNKKRRWSEAQQHNNELTRWFKEKVELDNAPKHIKWLSLGPSTIARRHFFYAEGQYEDTHTNRLREPVEIQNVVIVNDDEIRLCREGVSERVNVHQMDERTENDSDVDETDWDWMEQ